MRGKYICCASCNIRSTVKVTTSYYELESYVPSLLNKEPRIPKCPRVLSGRVSKCLSALGALAVPSDCQCALQGPWMFECPLSVYKCAFYARISHQMLLKQNVKYKKVFCIYEKKMEGNVSRNLILKQNLCGIWSTFDIVYKSLIFINTKFSFLSTHLYKELSPKCLLNK